MVLLATSAQSFAQKHNVTGVVRDKSGETLVGVSVFEQGTMNAVATDINGKYSLMVSKPAANLEVTMIGLNTAVIPACPSITRPCSLTSPRKSRSSGRHTF